MTDHRARASACWRATSSSPAAASRARSPPPRRADAKESIGEAGGDQGFVGFITDDLLPTSFVSPFVENEILRVLVLALLIAAAVSGLPKVQREKVVGVFEVAGQVIFRVIRLIMWAAPIGAFGGMAFTVAKFGGTSLTSLGLLMVTFWGTCAVFVFGVLGLVARVSGFSIIRLIRLIRDELLIILGTSSSETVLPRLLAKLQAAGASQAGHRRGAPDGLLVQPRRHLHLPHAGRAVHRPGGGAGHAARRPRSGCSR